LKDLDFWQMDFPAPPSSAERPLGLVLECGSCGETVTLDSETSTAVTPAASTAATSTAAVEERRVRAKVNYFACVQSAAFGKDVVSCINMSRDGVGFRTKNAYVISTEVTVAVPFSQESPNAPAIYVPARVVNISELPELQMFRWGVAFLPIAGTRTHT
jgi:hypothetical protein